MTKLNPATIIRMKQNNLQEKGLQGDDSHFWSLVMPYRPPKKVACLSCKRTFKSCHNGNRRCANCVNLVSNIVRR